MCRCQEYAYVIPHKELGFYPTNTYWGYLHESNSIIVKKWILYPTTEKCNRCLVIEDMRAGAPIKFLFDFKKL